MKVSKWSFEIGKVNKNWSLRREKMKEMCPN